MPDLLPVTLHEQIAEVERELALRDHVYPRRIAAKQMSQQTADRGIDRMRAVLTTLRELAAGQKAA
jgi:hypothetical protein